jgi:hypothetical protein
MLDAFHACVLIAVRLRLNAHLIKMWSAMPVKPTDKVLFSPVHLLSLPFSSHGQSLHFQFSQ